MTSAIHASTSTTDCTYYTFRAASRLSRSRTHAPEYSTGLDRTNTTNSPPPVPSIPRSKTPGNKYEPAYDSAAKERENFAAGYAERPKATEPLGRTRTQAPTAPSWSPAQTPPTHAYAQTKAHVNSPPRVYTYRLFDDEMGPWAQTVNTYTWVMEQEYRERLQRTEQAWASHAQAYVPPSRAASAEAHFVGARSNRRLYDDTPYNLGSRSDPSRWEQAAHDVDSQARSWMLQEEARRREALREAEHARIVQDEVRKIQERIMRKRERLKAMEERWRAHEEAARERERHMKARLERAMADAWRAYESRWASISASSSNEPLSFASIPWPMLDPPSSPTSLTLSRISAFILSNAHSQGHTTRERIKEALRRWHPDRFGRFLQRVNVADRAAVEEAVGIVARCLNEMLSRHGQQEQSPRSH